MSIRKKKIFFIATFLIIAAIAVVLCVNYFNGGKINEYDGTLVELNTFMRCI